jgi:hypothetical protein
MAIKKKKAPRQHESPRTDGDYIHEFADKPRDGRTQTTPGVVTDYQPDVPGVDNLRRLLNLLDECLHTAGTMKNKQASELVKKLRAARRRADLIHDAG